MGTGGRTSRSTGPAAILLVLLRVGAASAAEGPDDTVVESGDKLQVDTWGPEAGLPLGTVTSLVRDDSGYLWLGTFAGLFRFSGLTFEEQVASTEVYANVARISALEQAAQGVWLGVEYGGVWLFDGGVFHEVEQPEALRSSIVWDLARYELPGSEESVLFVAASAGLWRYHPQAGWEALSTDPVFSILPVDEDTLWLGNHTAVWRQNGRQAEAPRATGSFFGLWQDPQGDVWAAEAHGLVLIPAEGEPLRDPTWTEEFQLGTAPVADSSGRLWFGTVDGVVLLPDWARAKSRLQAGEPLQPERFSLGSAARSLLVDTDDTLWLGTKTAGLIRVTQRPYDRIPLPEGVNGATTGPLARSADRTWLALDCEQLHAYSNGQWVDSVHLLDAPAPFEASRCVTSLAVAPDNDLLIGLEGALWRVSGDTWLPPIWHTDSLDPNETATLIQSAASGGFWVGTSTGRLFRGWLDADDPLRVVDVPPEVPRILSAAEPVEDQLILGTDNGIWVRHNNQWTHHGCDQGFACGSVRDLMVSEDGVVWAATYGGGLGWFDGGTVGRITPAVHALPDGFLSSLTRADSGQVWIHGNRGLYSVGQQDLDAAREGSLRQLQLRRFDVGEANGWARPSAQMSSDGEMWLVTVEGLVSFSLDAAVDSWHPAAVQIRSVTAGSIVFRPEDDIVRLSSDMPRSVEISWSSPVLRPDQVARYRYRLYRRGAGGAKEAFSAPLSRTSINYAALEPGSYLFEVQAVGAAGQEGAITRLELSIEQGWIEHPGLPVVLSALVLLAGVGMVWWRLRLAERRSRTLVEEVSERKAAEIRLEAQRRFYQQVFDSAGVALLLFDASSPCIEVNREACSLFRVDRKELMTWTPAHLGLESAGSDGQPGRCRRPDGSTFPARVVSASFVADGKRYFLVSVTDVSGLLVMHRDREQRRLDHLLAHQRSILGRFVHHTLASPPNTGPNASDTTALRSSASTWTAAEVGPAPVVDVGRALRSLEDSLRLALPTTLELAMAVESGGGVRIHNSALEDILLVGVLQAAEGLKAGGRVRLTVDRATDSVVFNVQGSGPTGPASGAPAPATSLSPPTVAERVARSLVEQAGGTWLRQSQPSGGVLVSVAFPDVQSIGEGGRPRTDSARLRTRSAHVCVVDDNAHVMRALQVPLELAGFHVTAFHDPEAALQWFRETSRGADVLVTDVVMPKMTGRQLADALQRVDPGLQVLFVSGYTDDVVLRRGVDRATENLLFKPFSKGDLLSRVDALVAQRRVNL